MAANPLVDRTRLSIAKYVIAILEDKPNFVSTLVEQSDEQCCKGNFTASVECCRRAYNLAQSNSDYAAQASALAHMGLHYFVSPAMEFDRAADQCEEASRSYHTAYQSRGEIASLIAAALVLLYACKRGNDRWHRSMRMFVLAAEVEGAPTNLVNRACTMRDAVEREFGSHTGAPHNPHAAGQPVNPPSPPPAPNPPPLSAPNPPTVDPVQPVPPNPPIPNPGQPIQPNSQPPTPNFRAALLGIIQDQVGEFPRFLGYLSIFAFMALGILLLIDLWYFLIVQPGIVLAFMTGTFLLLFSVPLVLMVVLIGARQLRLIIPRFHTAIVNDRGRIWVIEEPSARWFLPLVEYVEAYIPMEWRTIDIPLHRMRANDGSIFISYAQVSYTVDDAMTVWVATIQPRSQNLKFLGMPKPIEANISVDSMDTKVRQLTAEVLLHIANTQRDLIGLQPALDDCARALLANRATPLGLRVYSVHIESFLP